MKKKAPSLYDFVRFGADLYQVVPSWNKLAYFWFTNTPMYLGYELYQSSIRLNLNHRSPGQRYHFAYQAAAAGRQEVVKAEIRNSLAKEKDYCAYTDTLRHVLSDTTVFINGIVYGPTEKIIDYTDNTGIIKST